MYQALYRKWRPQTFDDVVGQTHITDTLKAQVAADRLSHAYLFTGTRGTGKTTCAKVLARAVNCQAPQNGNPCNHCPACLGIENGSILDVLELDAASNNGVDQVRALRDEAVYTPAAVRKRVYIVDEVHMLSTPAFNALLKILEEPPSHLMFILATTELHKVPATIKSRCQQFSFKRILPGQIAQRLSYVAQQESITLTQEGAELLARLADGGMRDALSLLDQCTGQGKQVDEQTVLDTLGLAGNLETAALMEHLAQRDVAGALDTLARLYGNGKEIGSVLGELSALARDLLLRKTAPQGCSTLLTGGYDETTMRSLGQNLSAQRLLQMLTQLQSTTAELSRSSNRRTDAELCLIRLCDEQLDGSFAGLSARVARLEEQLAKGILSAPTSKQPLERAPSVPTEKPTPTAEEPVPQGEKTPQKRGTGRKSKPEAPADVPQQAAPESEKQPSTQGTGLDSEIGNSAFWPSFAEGLRGKVSPMVMPYLTNPSKVKGIWKNGQLTLWVDGELTHSMLKKPAVLDGIRQGAAVLFGVEKPQICVVEGQPPEPTPKQKPEEKAPLDPAAEEREDALNELLAFGEQFDNIIIQ